MKPQPARPEPPAVYRPGKLVGNSPPPVYKPGVGGAQMKLSAVGGRAPEVYRPARGMAGSAPPVYRPGGGIQRATGASPTRVIQPMNWAAMAAKGGPPPPEAPKAKPAPKPQANPIEWVWTYGGLHHEGDGWWDAMGFANRTGAQAVMAGYLADAAVDAPYSIDMGTCQNPDEHISKTCSIVFRKTMEGGIRKVIVVHCGPADDY